MNVLVYTGWPVNAWRIPVAQVARLGAACPDITFLHATSAEEATRDIVNVDALMSPHLTLPILERAKCLRWVHSGAAAVADLLPLAELARREIVVTNSRGVQAIPMAEQVMAGTGPFGVVMDRTPYLRIDTAAATFWAPRGVMSDDDSLNAQEPARHLRRAAASRADNVTPSKSAGFALSQTIPKARRAGSLRTLGVFPRYAAIAARGTSMARIPKTEMSRLTPDGRM
jgi:hypothetical protein